ncbi:MAG: radical SAM protein [Desulfobacterales bacterium]|nr:radical SAM protein [Desulfobacterales bacterium]
MNDYRFGDGLHIELTSRCRLACPYCERTRCKGQYQVRDLPRQLVFRLVENPKFKKIMLAGTLGDPIYHPCFLEIVEKIKQSDKELRIATNGSGKTLAWWEKVFNRLDSRDRVCFGLDGLQDTAHLYRVNTNFTRVFEAMKLGAAIRRATIEWQFIIFSFNQHQIEAAARLAHKSGIRFTLLQSGRFKSDDPLLPDLTLLPEALQKKLAKAGR